MILERWGSLEFEGAELLVDDLPYNLIRCHDSDRSNLGDWECSQLTSVVFVNM